MRVILLQDIKGFGRKFEVKEAKDGYARNFLLPRKLAMVATEAELEKLDREKKVAAEKRQQLISKLKEEARRIEDLTLEFKLKTGEKNEVFGSISERDIENALKERGFGDVRANLKQPLKSLGERKLEVNLGEGIKAGLKILICQLEG